MNASLTEYLRDLADWIHHEAFHKLPDELEEKADEVRELAQTLESGGVVVPRDLVEEWLNAMRVNREARLSGKGDIGANQALLAYASQALEEAFTSALSRLRQNGGESRGETENG